MPALHKQSTMAYCAVHQVYGSLLSYLASYYMHLCHTGIPHTFWVRTDDMETVKVKRRQIGQMEGV